MDLALKPMHVQAQALRRREVSSVELTRAYLDRSEVAAGLGAWLLLDRDGAVQAAEAADQRRARGEDAPLLGIPVALKDNMCSRGLPTTCASRILEGFVPRYDAFVVQRLRAAGAVILGKTNLDEFAMGSSTENSAFGLARNPWDPTRIPGGSSGGSAVAAAASLASVALGSDTGGSIRQPAAMCGIVGLKPTWGRISRRGLVAFASSLDQIGPMTRDVRDAALVYKAIAGHDPGDSTSLDVPVEDPIPELEAGVGGMRIGVLRDGLGDGVAPDIRDALHRAVAALTSEGATRVEADLPNAAYGVSIYYLIAAAEAASNLSRFDGVRYGHRAQGGADDLAEMYCDSRGEGFGAEVKRRILLGTYTLSAGYHDAYYNRAQGLRQGLVADFAAAFARCDVLIGPTTPTTAFPLGDKLSDPLAMYLSDAFTIPANLAGIAAISVPVGLDRDGLPIGLHLSAPARQEARLLRVARAVERAMNPGERRPREVWAQGEGR